MSGQSKTLYFVKLAAFLTSKSAVFFGPLLLSNILTGSEYGLLESALAVAMITALFLGAGTSAAIPYFTIKHKDDLAYLGVYIHLLFVVLLTLALSFIDWTAGTYPITLTLVLIAHFSLQRILAAEFATKSRPALSSFAAAYLYMVLLVAAGSHWLGFDVGLSTLKGFLTIAALPLIAWLLWKLYPLWGAIPDRFQAVHQLMMYRFATSPLLLTAMMLTAASFVRLIGPVVVGEEETGRYGFFLRLAAISVVFCQFLSVLWYRKIYESDQESADNKFTIILAIVSVASIFVYSCSEFILGGYFVYLEGFEPFSYLDVFSIVSAFSIFWAGLAMTEALICREGMAGPAALIDLCAASAGFLIFFALVYFNVATVSLESLASAHLLVSGMIVLLHCEVLRRKNVYLRKFYTTSAIMFSIAFMGILANAYFTL